MNGAEFRLPTNWPRPFDGHAAERLLERFAALGRAEARLAERPEVAAMLCAIGGNSPYLADLAVREADSLCAIIAYGPDAVAAAALRKITATAPSARREAVSASLRRAKRIVALATAVADIGDIWPLEHVTATLSELAETALSLATAHLLRTAHDAGE